jgi:hypothetical protein
MMARLKLNKIRSIIKSGEFNKDEQIKVRESFLKRRPRKFCNETFYNIYENLLPTPNNI